MILAGLLFALNLIVGTCIAIYLKTGGNIVQLAECAILVGVAYILDVGYLLWLAKLWP